MKRVEEYDRCQICGRPFLNTDGFVEIDDNGTRFAHPVCVVRAEKYGITVSYGRSTMSAAPVVETE